MAEEEESIEEKKARMRAFMEADRKLEREKDKRKRRRGGCGGGCLLAQLKLLAVIGVIGGIVYGVYLWHPWGYEYDEFDAAETPGICPPGVDGSKSVQHLTILGQRVKKVDEAVICVE